mmetsp:Transcript_7870/g.14274  ORF Transcript_7870/g.14274 Transcript_7870/m.14274 type:complete len:89 (+) Transcript_7870:356-622(+)
MSESATRKGAYSRACRRCPTTRERRRETGVLFVGSKKSKPTTTRNDKKKKVCDMRVILFVGGSKTRRTEQSPRKKLAERKEIIGNRYR